MKISPTQYAKILVALSEEGGDPSRVAASFLSFVRKRRGTKKLSGIVRAAEKFSDEKAGRVSLLAETASAADEPMRREIARSAGNLFPGKEVSLRYVVRKDLLGGVRFSLDDEVIDGTLRRRLDEMGRRIKDSE